MLKLKDEYFDIFLDFVVGCIPDKYYPEGDAQNIQTGAHTCLEVKEAVRLTTVEFGLPEKAFFSYKIDYIDGNIVGEVQINEFLLTESQKGEFCVEV